MEQNEQEQRMTAAKEFQQSLDSLQHILEENPIQEQKVADSVIDKTPNKEIVKDQAEFDLADWEDAIADIEQYFQNKNKEEV